MRLSFIAHAHDEIALRALKLLGGDGHDISVLQPGAMALKSSIALFSVEQEVRNRFLRLSPYRMAQEGVVVPQWASETPFVVAISSVSARLYPGGFRSALRDMAKVYGVWEPWMKRPVAPWNPGWHTSAHDGFAEWIGRARNALPNVSCTKRLGYRLEPIFPIKEEREIRTLVVTGCALFNKPHTDVVDTMNPGKRLEVVQGLESIVHDSGVSDVRFVVPRSDLLRPEFREHFHPFIFMDVADVSAHLGSSLTGSARLLGRSHFHARSDAEVALALDRSGDALVHNVIAPLAANTGVPIVPVSWSDYIGKYIADAMKVVSTHRAVAEEIYLERVRTRPSYASLHVLDPERGLKRTLSNNVFYVAEAMFLRDNPDVAVVNCEFADTFWKGLEEVLSREVWGDFRPYIGMVPEPMRQPWGY
jgi:hypothetical protein